MQLLKNRRNSHRFAMTVLSGMVLLLSCMICGLPAAQAQEGDNPHFTQRSIPGSGGAILDEFIINGPPTPPPGHEIERLAVALPIADKASGINVLTVPAFNWVFGCSAVSGAMIAGYYDRNGYPDMYTGPTNGGVMPLNNSSWPTWTDGYTTYPNLPLAASRQGVDGRATRGSLDDYWVQYGSSSADPYIAYGWTQHPWGDAIGDYMKTSQSAYENTDGSTAFYNWTAGSAAPLTCADMVTHGIHTNDGTYGRKLFYEARGYTVTDCYNQKTDNNGGGFTFDHYRSEIDAGRPVMLNLAGHTVVGTGYDDATRTVYLHDTWDYNPHTMTWGGSYAGMELLSVSIVNIRQVVPRPIVSSFTLNHGALSTMSTAVTLNNTVTVLTPTHYMAGESPSFSGAAWLAYSTTPSFTLSSGDGIKTVYFKVRAGDGTESAVISDRIKLTTSATTDHYRKSFATYSFEDISATGIPLNLADDSHAILSIPFSFDFYGTVSSTIAVGSNGTVNFQDGNPGFANVRIPGTNSYGVERFIALLWDDLNPEAGGYVQYQVLGSAPGRRLIVQWTDVPRYGIPGGGTFQVVLYEGSNNILFQYKDVIFGHADFDNGKSATVGIQRDSTSGLQYSYNSASLRNNTAILFSPGTGNGGSIDGILYLLLN